MPDESKGCGIRHMSMSDLGLKPKRAFSFLFRKRNETKKVALYGCIYPCSIVIKRARDTALILLLAMEQGAAITGVGFLLLKVLCFSQTLNGCESRSLA